MNKKALKEFAVYARNELRSQIALRAQAFGITPKGSPVLISGSDYVEIHNKKFPFTYRKGFEKLISEFETKGYDNVLEEVAYTWFNRLIAIRFMEVHNYLPSKVRVLSSETKGKVDPDILTEYQTTELPVNKEEISHFLAQGNREEAFRKLLIAQCNELSEIMPFLFEKLADYTELLLPESLLHADSLINKIGKELEDENFEQVEVIGWLYQYYISEKKDEVFEGLRKNKKITKENIPAATQLFTPHWIVRYMVDNSLGQMWLESHPDSEIMAEMKYYVEPADQEAKVQRELDKLRNPNLSPEEITILDPACGSGHILVYAFDLLYKIYEERGYSSKEIAAYILEKNLFGLDIDNRAVQLASFALIMKAREKTKRIFRFPPKLNLFSIKESNELPIPHVVSLLGETDHEKNKLQEFLEEFVDAKNFGSILQPIKIDFDHYLSKLTMFQSGTEQLKAETFEIYDRINELTEILVLGKILSSKYDVVITNPPYMGSKGMNPSLSRYVNAFYKDAKADLFAVFMERCHSFTKEEGFHAVINQHSWMFLSSFEKLRRKILSRVTLLSMVHLGAKAFEEIGGEVVQTTSYVLRNKLIPAYVTTFYRLVHYSDPRKKEIGFLEQSPIYRVSQMEFNAIPGFTIAYWATNAVRKVFRENPNLSVFAEPKQGLATADNNRFLRKWYEVSNSKIGFNLVNSEKAVESRKKWFPYNKGGDFRKWYGNQEYVINWEHDGEELKNFKPAVIRNPRYYFKEGITWSRISGSYLGVRYSPPGFVFDCNGPSLFPDHKDLHYILGLLCSHISIYLFKMINPTLALQVGSLSILPVIMGTDEQREFVTNKVEKVITLSKEEWDSYEISWNFQRHPFMKFKQKGFTIQDSYSSWNEEAEIRFQKLKRIEMELNQFFIELYDLQDDLQPDVPDEEVTISHADRERDAKSFLSYCIGLMMGRYSLDVEGLTFAGGDWDPSKYHTFQPDSDGILPLTDMEYFEDDVVKRLQELLVILFGQDSLAENLRWLAESLTLKANETPVERLRRYFFDEFYVDHCKIYQKRPIYWMAESGSKKGYRALFYLHRYTPETLATMRISYVQNLQEKLHQEQKRLEQDLINPDLSAAMKKRYDKQLSTIKAQQEELIDYDKKLAELANLRITLDLDDGVVVNYERLSPVLAKIK